MVEFIDPVPLTDEELATDLLLIAMLRESPVLSERERECLAGIVFKIDDLLESRAIVRSIMTQISMPKQGERKCAS